ncbi:MAG: SPFH domain-containing protein [Candidatus Methylacidiphilales bacterium]|nr:SPFH domain-containing protein [Candidatus Methylacidiphilales bacterium]
MNLLKSLFYPEQELIIRDSHRGVRFEDGVIKGQMEPGLHLIPVHIRTPFRRTPKVEVIQVDIRERELTIKGQEILTADKVAVRVNVLVQFRITDPIAAVNKVENYAERLYSDVQLAARRSLAAMTLDTILTNRNQLSEEILRDLTAIVGAYGVAILRADIKDLIFPGDLQAIMNRVLAAERNSQAQLIEARTAAETQTLAARARDDATWAARDIQLRAEIQEAEARLEMERQKRAAEIEAVKAREEIAALYQRYPELLRLRELETLRELSLQSNARIYVNFNRQDRGEGLKSDEGKE